MARIRQTLRKAEHYPPNSDAGGVVSALRDEEAQEDHCGRVRHDREHQQLQHVGTVRIDWFRLGLGLLLRLC